MDLIRRYENIIQSWLISAREYVASPYDRPDLAYYGTGTNHWGIQTHMKGFSAFAVAAADSRKPEDIELALKMLRFTLESYIGGSYHCTEGEQVQWGHHWLAALAVERMMHGVDALEEWLTDHDRLRLRQVLVSEANYICDERRIVANHIDYTKNLPESNLWTGALCHRVAAMYPDEAHIETYLNHGTALLLNSISVPSDAESEKLYAGKPMKEWFVGANFFEDYALGHHGYLNVGYMVICLSNIAMLHFSLKKKGITPPDALYHHFADLWRLVRTCVFDDGRLMRIGGDSRVRYCYCQDYLVPVFALVEDVLGEDMSGEESGWLNMIDKEMAYNGDHSFLSKRCELMIERSPLYYTRLESDRACTLSMLWFWRKHFTFKVTEKPSKDQHWYNDFHGSYYHRSAERIASFTWRAGLEGRRPQGNIVPPSDSSMAEWKYNMTSFVEGAGVCHSCKILAHSGKLVDGGFITGGKYNLITSELLEENDNINVNAQNKLVFCALPDDRTVVTLQRCHALRRCWILDVRPLNFEMPNDLFNDEIRNYEFHGKSLTVDGQLTFTPIYGGEIGLRKGTARTVNVDHLGNVFFSHIYGDRGMLRVDDITVGGSNKMRWYDKNEILFDFAAAIRTDKQETESMNYFGGNVRAVRVRGDNGKYYIVVVNFGENEVECTVFGHSLTLSGEGYELICE